MRGMNLTKAMRAARFGALGLVMATAGAAAAEFERPPAYSPASVLGASAQGPNYSVSNPVASDGLLRHYKVRTTVGDFEVTGDALMAARIGELKAIHALDATNATQKFGQAVVKTGLGPVIFAGNLVVHPIDTTQNTVSGVGQFLNDIGSGMNNMGASRDGALASLTGEAREKRLIAAQLGVDPYTDFKPLATRLDELGGAAAAGSLVVSGALIAVPGAAGIAASDASTANTLGGAVMDYSSAQLMDMNRDKLARVGVDRAAADRLFANPYYTPLDATAIAEALTSLGRVRGLGAIVARAAAADSRATAYFIRRRIEMTAAWRKRAGTISAFEHEEDPRFPLFQTSGRTVGVFPIDSLSWTPETARVVGAMTAAAAGPKKLVITGTATPLAKANLAAHGWSLEERAKL